MQFFIIVTDKSQLSSFEENRAATNGTNFHEFV